MRRRRLASARALASARTLGWSADGSTFPSHGGFISERRCARAALGEFVRETLL